jgi:hypothetical protein
MATSPARTGNKATALVLEAEIGTTISASNAATSQMESSHHAPVVARYGPPVLLMISNAIFTSLHNQFIF